MKILGIDTAMGDASVALLTNREVIAEKFRSNSEAAGPLRIGKAQSTNHAAIILPLVEELLNSVGICMADISGIAVSVGPGSFTGVRVGIATVKGLAYGSGVRVAGVSTLLANAARVGDFDGLICPLLDARKNEVYAAIFSGKKNDLTRLSDDRVTSVESALSLVHRFANEMPILFIGDGAVKYETQLRDSFGGRAQICGGDSYASVASSVAAIGYDRLRDSRGDELMALEPIYLRIGDAESK